MRMERSASQRIGRVRRGGGGGAAAAAARARRRRRAPRALRLAAVVMIVWHDHRNRVPCHRARRPGRARRLGVMLLLVTLIVVGVAEADPRPNVLQIMADDMGQWAMGAYGNDVIQSPTLDKLAAQGALFEQAYCNTPVCSASRASYLTGRLPSQHGVHDWIAGGNGNAPNVAVYPDTEACGKGINYTASETAFSDVLKQKGYHLGFAGKIHVGNQPFAQHGFDHWFVHQSGGGDYQTPPFVVNATATAPGRCTLIPGYISDIVATDVVEQVNMHAKDAKPWYMAMHFTAPHAPYTGPDGLARSMHPAKYTELYDNISVDNDPLPNEPVAAWQSYASGTCTDWRPRTVTCFAPFKPACRAGLPRCRACQNGSTPVITSRRKEYIKGYFGAVTAMDANIGRVIDAVEAAGLTRKTLVIFTSDHVRGPPSCRTCGPISPRCANVIMCRDIMSGTMGCAAKEMQDGPSICSTLRSRSRCYGGCQARFAQGLASRH
jgi:arylsulfatase A-like enzyme